MGKFRNFIAIIYLIGTCFSCSVFAQGPETPVELNTLWELQLGTDYTSTVNPTERDQHPYVGIFYIPAKSTDALNKATIPDLLPFYRLVNSASTDHMDSTVAGEGGYLTEGAIGYVWANGAAKPGLSGVTRYYDSAAGTTNVGDHATVVDPSPVPHAQSFPSYSLDVAPIGYGYARYPGTAVSLASVSGGGAEVKSNVVTGCSVWEWWWQGAEFINDYDYGRQLSTAVYYPFNSTATNSLQETGDIYGAGDPNVVGVDTAHPSPCASLLTSGNTQVTAAIPLDWSPANFGGGLDNPVIYPDVTIGKNLNLDWIGPDGVDRQWPLTLYQSVVAFPSSMTGNYTIESPTAYLNSAFNYYYYFTPSTGAFTYVSAATVKSAGAYNVPGGNSGPQAVILSSGSSSTSPAMGVFIDTVNAGFALYDESTGGCTSTAATSTTCQYSSNFAKWTVVYGGGLGTSPWAFKTWIVTDTLPNVETDIKLLNSWAAAYPTQMASH